MKYKEICINMLSNLNKRYTRNFDLSVSDNKNRIQIMENGKLYGRIVFTYSELYDCLKLFEDLHFDLVNEGDKHE